ncbi:MAG: alkaline phosphatase D family protein [Planctomycetota bacterium]
MQHHHINRRVFLLGLSAFFVAPLRAFASATQRLFKVSVSDAHVGNLEVDTKLLDSYGRLPDHIRQFYLDARAVFEADSNADFTDPKIVAAAKYHGLALMSGPMLGDVRSDGTTVWIRPASKQALTLEVGEAGQAISKTIVVESPQPGVEQRIRIDGLTPQTTYAYAIHADDTRVAGGTFITAPDHDQPCNASLTFGSCFHKIGLHNPNLIGQILKREPTAMVMYGDLAVDDRNNQVNMHRADYQLRDVSRAWRDLAGNVPMYASWDDHDYFDNDLSGIPSKFQAHDRDALRGIWHQNWNNPPADPGRKGIYFSTRIGPVELIMLDTRSCRDNDRRNQNGSYLGSPQMAWLKQTLLRSTAPFKVITSGTMWSDYISNGKDSWGTWDKQAREELFAMIGRENVTGVLLVSGDRHGARAFKIPRETGYDLYEFEPATLGGIRGPRGLADDQTHQLFGYDGKDFIAFGEFTFDTTQDDPSVTFRLIHETGKIMEEHTLLLSQLSG